MSRHIFTHEPMLQIPKRPEAPKASNGWPGNAGVLQRVWATVWVCHFGGWGLNQAPTALGEVPWQRQWFVEALQGGDEPGVIRNMLLLRPTMPKPKSSYS